ncbi:unnamed protein product [Orchesella dallaii]|uniref:28S ribosomal protein S24, mitochondrial n=1 Tax=Orchesella dallaii TaxID=48710 RepID=A0ABP1S1V5_9HEXA
MFGTAVAASPLRQASHLTLLKITGFNPHLHYPLPCRLLQTCSILSKSQSGRHSPTIKHNKPLTYEEAQKPNEIAMRKSWTTMNTSALDFKEDGKKRLGALFGVRTSQTVTEDMFIRRFLTGTWHNLFVSEILIKRQANMIRIAGLVVRSIPPRKMYFLIGYTEELLSYWIQCPVKLELQTVDDRRDVVFKYI